MPVNAPKLVCTAILVADEFYLDRQQDKLVIVGVLSHIRVPQLPWLVPRVGVLFSLTSGHGAYHLRLSIDFEGAKHTEFPLENPLRLTDPLELRDEIVTVEGLRFEVEGKYWAVLRCGEEILAQRPFYVVVTPEPSVRIVRLPPPGKPRPRPPGSPRQAPPDDPAGSGPPPTPDNPSITGPGL